MNAKRHLSFSDKWDFDSGTSVEVKSVGTMVAQPPLCKSFLNARLEDIRVLLCIRSLSFLAPYTSFQQKMQLSTALVFVAFAFAGLSCAAPAVQPNILGLDHTEFGYALMCDKQIIAKHNDPRARACFQVIAILPLRFPTRTLLL